MAVFEIKGPDGATYEINAPDDATEDQVLAYAQQNYAPNTAQPQGGVNGFMQGLEGPVKGLVGGAAEIGNNLINASTFIPRTLLDLQQKHGLGSLITGEKELSKVGQWNKNRQQANKEFISENEGLPGFGLGRVGAHILGTLGAGSAAGTVLKGLSQTPNALRLAEALRTGGFAKDVGTATNMLGGAGAASLGSLLVDPSTAPASAAIGAALPVVGGAASSIASAARPLTEGGREKILGRLLNRTADDPSVAQTLMAAKGNTPGFTPTAGQASNNAGLATMERVFRERNPQLFDDTVNAQYKALADSVRGMGADDLSLGAMKESRDSAAEALYGTAMASDAQRVDEALRAANAARNTSQGGLMLGGSDRLETTPTLKTLSEAPAMKDAINAAKNLYANKNPGQSLGDPTTSLEGLHYIKLAIDNQMNSGNTNTALASHGKAALSSIKEKLLNEIDTLAPVYGNARKSYTELSKPITQREVGNEIAKKYIPAIYSDVPVPPQLNHDQLARILNDGDKIAQSVTGFKGATLENSLSPEQIQTLQNAVKDSQYIKAGQMRGKPVNSSTFQNLAFGNDMAESGVGRVLSSISPISAPLNILRGARDIAYKGANERLAERLAQVLSNPQEAAKLMQNSEVASAITEMLRKAGTGINRAIPATAAGLAAQ